MKSLKEQNTTIWIPPDWHETKWDVSQEFGEFQSLAGNGTKGVDFIFQAPDENEKIWFIEVKDFRFNNEKLLDEMKHNVLCLSLKAKFVHSYSGIIFANKKAAKSSNNHFPFSNIIESKPHYRFLFFYSITDKDKTKLKSLFTRLEDMKTHFRDYGIDFKVILKPENVQEAWNFELTA